MAAKRAAAKGRWTVDEAKSFFLLRTPALPFDTFSTLGEQLEAPRAARAMRSAPPESREGHVPALIAALEHDRTGARAHLRAVVESVQAREALFVASPSLLERLPGWLTAPDSDAGQRVEPPLVRYVTRMSSRAMTFGLFAGASFGTLGERADFGALDAPWSRHTVVDYFTLLRCAEELSAHAPIRRSARYRLNASLFVHGPHARFAMMVPDGEHHRCDTVTLERDEFLDAVAETARDGATFGEICSALVRCGSKPDDAAEYADSLVEQGFLVSEIAPRPTAQDPVADFAGQLVANDATRDIGARIGAAHDALQRLDAGGLGHSAADYMQALRSLDGLPGVSDPARAFRTQLFRSSPEVSLEIAVAQQILDVVEFLRRCPMPPRSTVLEDFARRFEERYEHREVPLLEALDPDLGIHFNGPAHHTPYIDGLGIEPKTVAPYPTRSWGPWEQLLLAKLSAALDRGDRCIELGDDDIAHFEHVPERELPDVLEVALVVGRASDSASRPLLFRRAHGPRIGAIAVRVAHDPKVRARLADALAADARSLPERAFAELANSPRVPVATALLRPGLRDYEIPCPDASSLPPERVLPLSDLLVSVHHGDIRVRSRRLNRRVEPRLTSAHAFRGYPFAPYAFLAELQARDRAVGCDFSWGALSDAPHLPRVVRKGVVLRRASWRLNENEVAALRRGDRTARFLAAQDLRERRKLPRYVVSFEGDRELVVDLDSTISVEAFLDTLGDDGALTLEELFPAPSDLVVSTQGKRFVNDAAMVLVRARSHAEEQPPKPNPAPLIDEREGERTFFPGSEWFFAKLYGAPESLPAIVQHVVAPIAAKHRATSDEPWFYLFYGDPDTHVRVRFRGRDHVASLLAALHESLASEPAAGLVRKVQVDTYVREVERYGGWRGIELAEQLFAVDCDAALEVFALDLSADELASAALLGVHSLFPALGFSAAEALAIAQRLRTRLAREHRPQAPIAGVEPAIAQRFRARRAIVERMLLGSGAGDDPWSPLRRIYAKRTERLAPIARSLRALDEAGRLTSPLDVLMESYVHMSILRLVHIANRTHELVFADFIARVLKSAEARAR